MQSIYGKKTTGSEVIPGTSKDDWIYPLVGSDTVDGLLGLSRQARPQIAPLTAG